MSLAASDGWAELAGADEVLGVLKRDMPIFFAVTLRRLFLFLVSL